MSGDGVRLQKFLSRAGVASRRASEELIREGRVRVDGDVVTEMGVRIDPSRSVVTVDGAGVERSPARWIAFHKPPGVLSTRSDPRGRPTVYDLLPDGRLRELFHVGRLDYMSEGLLLLTNEGDVAHRVLHPSSEVPRRYEVSLLPPVPGDLARRILEGVDLEDGPASAEAAALLPPDEGEGGTLLLTLTEGRNREIRRILEFFEVGIRSLRRLAFGPVELGELKPGDWRSLTEREIERLRRIGEEG